MVIFRIKRYRELNILLQSNDHKKYIQEDVSYEINQICKSTRHLTTSSNHFASLYINNNTLFGTWWDEIDENQILTNSISIINSIKNKVQQTINKSKLSVSTIEKYIDQKVNNIPQLIASDNNVDIENDDDQNNDSDNEDTIHQNSITEKLEPTLVYDNYEQYVIEEDGKKGEIYIITDPFPSTILDGLLHEREGVERVKWGNAFSAVPHYGVRLPDSHLTYLLTTCMTNYPAYVSGLSM